MAHFCVNLLAIFFLQGALANQNIDTNEIQEGIYAKLLDRIDRLENKLEVSDGNIKTLEETIASRDRKIDQMERKQFARDNKVKQLEAKMLAHDRYIDLLKANIKANAKKHQSDLELVHKDIKRCKEMVREDVRLHDLGRTATHQGNASNTRHESGGGDISPRVQRSLRNSQFVNKVTAGNRFRRNENEMEVAFFATLTQTTSHIGTQQTIKFDHVVTNVGTGYNPHIGVFMAPVPGVYVFSVTLTTESRHVSHYNIYKNSMTYSTMLVNGSENNFDTTSQTVVLELAKGDAITVRHVDNDHALHGYNYCVFSGFLLTQNPESPDVIVGK